MPETVNCIDCTDSTCGYRGYNDPHAKTECFIDKVADGEEMICLYCRGVVDPENRHMHIHTAILKK